MVRPLPYLIQSKMKMMSTLIALILLALATAACSVDDDRDLCCARTNVMRYSYRPTGREEFHGHIRSLRHLLYDGHGRFMRELDPGPELQEQSLDLPEGSYTILTLGNLLSSHSLLHADQPIISSLELHPADARVAREALGNADELFWGVRHFDIDTNGMITDTGPDRRWDDYTLPTTEMNNIHCHLRVVVEWNNIPDYYGDYAMELTGVPTAYRLDPGSAGKADGFIVPPHHTEGIHRMCVPLEADMLDGELVTLRYTDKVIPTLRLYHEDEQIGPTIDLKKAFREWGWYPSRVHVQEYAVRVRLFGDGSAEVSPLIEGSIVDWINGGYFS